MVAVSAATLVVSVVVVSAAAFSASLAVAVAAAFTAQHLGEAFYLLVVCVAVFDDFAFEAQGLAGQGMVHVEFYVGVIQFDDASVESLSVFVLQGDNGVFENMLAVKLAVHLEGCAGQVDNMGRIVVAVGLVLVELEVKLCVFVQAGYLVLEGIQCDAKPADEDEGAFCCRFFYQCLVAVFRGVQLVCHGDVLVLWLFHFLLLMFLFKYIDNICKVTHFISKNRHGYRV